MTSEGGVRGERTCVCDVNVKRKNERFGSFATSASIITGADYGLWIFDGFDTDRSDTGKFSLLAMVYVSGRLCKFFED